jgi:S1-C subfamily serine protease
VRLGGSVSREASTGGSLAASKEVHTLSGRAPGREGEEDMATLLRTIASSESVDPEAVRPSDPAGPDPRDDALLDAYSRAVVSVVDAVGPAVVSIVVGSRASSAGGRDPGLAGSGSGVLIAPDGYVVTNHHVVGRARDVRVGLSDGRVLPARTIGGDGATDLAVVRVEASGLPYATLAGGASVRPGHLAIAIGNPLGFSSTVSAGVVSAIGRALWGRDGRVIEDVIQHTAPLNPGSSGGPLVDSRSRVIGINTAIIAMAQGIGFAIPASTAEWVVPQLLAHGRVRRSWLGLAGRTRPVPRALARRLALLADAAVEVMEVVPGGPAAKAGVRPGDWIVSFLDAPVRSVDALYRALADWPGGRSAPLVVIRGETRLILEVRPEEAPESDGKG